MTRPFFSRLALFLAVTALCACASNPDDRNLAAPTATFPVSIGAHATDQQNLPGVEFALGKQRLGQTDESGRASLRLRGSEGDSVALNVKCPAGYASPERPLSIGLRHLGVASTAA